MAEKDQTAGVVSICLASMGICGGARMDLLNRIDWVGDDGLLEFEGRQVLVERIGPEFYSISAPDEGDDAVTFVGLAALSYWLTNWSRER